MWRSRIGLCGRENAVAITEWRPSRRNETLLRAWLNYAERGENVAAVDGAFGFENVVAVDGAFGFRVCDPTKTAVYP